jgi:hypothetical protein
VTNSGLGHPSGVTTRVVEPEAALDDRSRRSITQPNFDSDQQPVENDWCDYGRDTERARLRMTNTKPLPFPPEPLRWAGIQLTRWSLNRADQRGGNRNLWLRTLDRLGLGFDS